MKSISELTELTNKRLLVRVDFNVPVDDEGVITESYRISSAKETIEYLLSRGANVVLISHITARQSFKQIMPQIQEILGRKIHLYPLAEELLIEGENLVLLDNLRQDPREEANDEAFAQELAEDFDYYINDAFAVCHRAHASVLAIAKFIPSYAGFLLEKEIKNLSEAVAAPVEGKVIILGGAKISTKLPVIQNFLDKAEKILVGGAIANNFFKARGIDVGVSVVDDSVKEVPNSPKIILPKDILVSKDKQTGTASELRDLSAEESILDIGPQTSHEFAMIIRNAKTVIWNGPMGMAEIETFAEGTQAVADAVAKVTTSIIGGGDTIVAVSGMLDRFTFVSTGGGAMLEFLAGNRLPGLEALGYYKHD